MIALGVVLALFAVSACKKEGGTGDGLVTKGTWRYKMTVTVETPEGIKSGYAVREMSNSRSKHEINLPQATHPAKVVGEAVVVDLGKHGKLLALMNGYAYGPDHANTILYKIFPSGSGGNSAEGIRFYRDLKAGPKAMTPGQYPVLVMFKDINDPKTVTSVMDIEKDVSKGWHQAEYIVKADRFEELFGKGVRLKEITMEMTEEPVTWGVVDEALPKNYRTVILDGWAALTLDEKARLSNLINFKKGVSK